MVNYIVRKRKGGASLRSASLGALTWGFICHSGALIREILRCRDRISVRIIRSLRLVFRKNCIRCGAKQFFTSHFLFEQSDRHRVILTDTLCRSGSSGGKGRRKTKQIPKRGRPCGCFFRDYKPSPAIQFLSSLSFILPEKRLDNGIKTA